MKVQKRNGDVVDFDISKIKKQIHFACEGLDINPLELESKVSISIKNKIKTSEIQELLIITANTLISTEEPDWTIVSGRLAMFSLHREIFKRTNIEYTDFPKFLQYAKSNNYYRKDIDSSYSEEEVLKLSKNINPDGDWHMTIAQVLSLKSKYILSNNRGYIEYPQFSDLASSMLLASKEQKKMFWAKEFFELLHDEIISLATPFKMNLRLEEGNTGSCFILPVGDSLAQISKSWEDLAIISREGGGVGMYFGNVRPSGTRTKTVKKSNNVNMWAKIINDIAVAVNQKGVRPGAVTPALDWWHLDIEDFIKMKAEVGGDLRLKCFDLFPQIVVDKYFVKRVREDYHTGEDTDLYLFSQYEFKEKTGIDIVPLVGKELYNAHTLAQEMAINGKLKNIHKITPKGLWKEVMTMWVETGDFYITSKDGLNVSNYLRDIAIANSANLCIESFSITKLPTEWATKGTVKGIKTTESDGLYHSCNLISIAVGNIKDDKMLRRACSAAVRALDNSIDLGTMPVLEAKTSSELLRNVGIGTMGDADWMAYNKLSYEKDEDLDKLEVLHEKIAYFCYEESCLIAEEKGSYPLFEKADYSTMFGRTPEELNKISKAGLDWISLNQRIRNNGIRNFLLIAIAPNSSSGILLNQTASYLPPHDKFNVQTLAGMTAPIIPKYLKNRFWYYKSKFNYSTETIIKVTERIQKWVDTGISMEVPMNLATADIKSISDTILTGFDEGELKGVYYSLTIDGRETACSDCAN
jgi:ribonucleoside-diphosphate reductase alpha chain